MTTRGVIELVRRRLAIGGRNVAVHFDATRVVCGITNTPFARVSAFRPKQDARAQVGDVVLCKVAGNEYPHIVETPLKWANRKPASQIPLSAS